MCIYIFFLIQFINFHYGTIVCKNIGGICTSTELNSTEEKCFDMQIIYFIIITAVVAFLIIGLIVIILICCCKKYEYCCWKKSYNLYENEIDHIY